ncbi:hypothetical protein MPER_11047, partial [Moniliophthora perniciosa FA553]
MRLLHVLFFLSFLEIISCRLANAVIDDAFGDSITGEMPAYIGDRWINGSQCTGCGLKPDPSQAHDGTWHDNTRHAGDPVRGIRFSFTGVAFSVYCIIPNNPATQVTAAYALTFRVDGQAAGGFSHIPDQLNDFTYGFQILTQNGLPNVKHTVELNLDSTTVDSVILFDYVQYTFDDGAADSTVATATSAPSTSLEAIKSKGDTGTTHTTDSSSSSSSPISTNTTAVVITPSPNLTAGLSAQSTSVPSITQDRGTITSGTSVSGLVGNANKTPLAVILGAVLGSLAALVLGLVVIFLLCR